MINETRINALIKTIKKSGRVNMQDWQEAYQHVVGNLEDLHKCGNRACIGGHLALMPEFRADGGYPSMEDGSPCLSFPSGWRCSGSLAVLHWLYESPTEVERQKVDVLVTGTTKGQKIQRWKTWKAKQAVEALCALRDFPGASIEQFAAFLNRL